MVDSLPLRGNPADELKLAGLGADKDWVSSFVVRPFRLLAAVRVIARP
jgi:hypothetical protein